MHSIGIVTLLLHRQVSDVCVTYSGKSLPCSKAPEKQNQNWSYCCSCPSSTSFACGCHSHQPHGVKAELQSCHVAGYSSSSGSSGSEQSGFMMPSSKNSTEVEGSGGSGSRRMWPTRVAKFLSSCSGNLGSSGKPSARILTASSHSRS